MRLSLASSALGLVLCASLLGCGPSGAGPADDAGASDGAGGHDAVRADGEADAGDDAGAPQDAAADTAVQQDAPAQHDAQTDTLPAFGCYDLLVNEFQPYGTSEGDEFVEIVGLPGADLSGVKLVYREAAGTSDVVLWAFSVGNTIPVTGFVLVASNTWSGGTPPAPGGAYLGGTTGKLASTGGGLAIKSGATVLDSVGYGNATNAFVQGAPTAAPPNGKSSSRSPRCANTGNNQADFSLSNPTPGH